MRECDLRDIDVIEGVSLSGAEDDDDDIDSSENFAWKLIPRQRGACLLDIFSMSRQQQETTVSFFQQNQDEFSFNKLSAVMYDLHVWVDSQLWNQCFKTTRHRYICQRCLFLRLSEWLQVLSYKGLCLIDASFHENVTSSTTFVQLLSQQS